MAYRHAFEIYLREQGLDHHLEEPLGHYTTYRCGGPARYFIQPRNIDELSGVLARAQECGISWRLLGGGACLLIRDGGVDGAVIRLRHMRQVDFAGERVRVESGYDLPRLIKESVRRGLTGLECLAGVPGTIGGSLVMNAGGRHGEIGDLVRYVDVMDNDGTVRRIDRDACRFRYRGSELGGRIILGCELELRPTDTAEVEARYRRILTNKKETQPLGSPNAGCVFKNPDDGKAGRLIEEAGLKGTRFGKAHVSQKHANFIINEGGCRSSDVMHLIDQIRATVRKRFEKELELELTIW